MTLSLTRGGGPPTPIIGMSLIHRMSESVPVALRTPTGEEEVPSRVLVEKIDPFILAGRPLGSESVILAAIVARVYGIDSPQAIIAASITAIPGLRGMANYVIATILRSPRLLTLDGIDQVRGLISGELRLIETDRLGEIEGRIIEGGDSHSDTTEGEGRFLATLAPSEREAVRVLLYRRVRVDRDRLEAAAIPSEDPWLSVYPTHDPTLPEEIVPLGPGNPPVPLVEEQPSVGPAELLRSTLYPRLSLPARTSTPTGGRDSDATLLASPMEANERGLPARWFDGMADLPIVERVASAAGSLIGGALLSLAGHLTPVVGILLTLRRIVRALLVINRTVTSRLFRGTDVVPLDVGLAPMALLPLSLVTWLSLFGGAGLSVTPPISTTSNEGQGERRLPVLLGRTNRTLTPPLRSWGSSPG